MITKQQWLSLHNYITERLETEEKFSLLDSKLEEMFGITHPFWKDMCRFAKETDRTYTTEYPWRDSSGEPVEFIYQRK